VQPETRTVEEGGLITYKDGLRSRAETILVAALALASINTAYLSWRFLALHAGLVNPGTGLCSLTAYVDCDRVLLTAQARAFYVPNALLGLGFFLGCYLWWRLGSRLGPEYRRHIAQALAFWLGVSSVATLWFFWLLVQLPYFCPLCPWNHLLNYVAFGAALRLALRTPRPEVRLAPRPLTRLVTVCISLFIAIQLVWVLAFAKGYVRL
jgi:uncharacterized membrane protein